MVVWEISSSADLKKQYKFPNCKMRWVGIEVGSRDPEDREQMRQRKRSSAG